MGGEGEGEGGRGGERERGRKKRHRRSVAWRILKSRINTWKDSESFRIFDSLSRNDSSLDAESRWQFRRWLQYAIGHDIKNMIPPLAQANGGTLRLDRGLNLSRPCRDGAVVRALASHQCGPDSIPRSGVICGLSLLVLFSTPRGFLRVLRFPLSSKTTI